MTARLLIVDDHDLMRESLKDMLSREEGWQVIGEASDGQEAVEFCRRAQPDLVLMDVRMPRMDGLSATREIKRQFPGISVLILTTHAEENYLLEAIRSGAAGYVLKDASQHELTSAIHRALDGEATLDRDLSTRLLQKLANETQKPTETIRSPDHHELLQPLTPREIEVLEQLALGKTNREIASEFGVAVGTVKSHVEHIITKLGVSDRTQAVVLALESGFISFPER